MITTSNESKHALTTGSTGGLCAHKRRHTLQVSIYAVWEGRQARVNAESQIKHGSWLDQNWSLISRWHMFNTETCSVIHCRYVYFPWTYTFLRHHHKRKEFSFHCVGSEDLTQIIGQQATRCTESSHWLYVCRYKLASIRLYTYQDRVSYTPADLELLTLLPKCWD